MSTKIHATTDALGNPLSFHLTPGQACDLDGSDLLLPKLTAQTILADKGYDAESLLLLLEQQEIQAVIPTKTNRKVQRVIDTDLYTERHLIECCIGKLKHFRRVFSRFDKLAQNYLSFVQFASTLLWLR